jgi:hypothetical protein
VKLETLKYWWKHRESILSASENSYKKPQTRAVQSQYAQIDKALLIWFLEERSRPVPAPVGIQTVRKWKRRRISRRSKRKKERHHEKNSEEDGENEREKVRKRDRDRTPEKEEKEKVKKKEKEKDKEKEKEKEKEEEKGKYMEMEKEVIAQQGKKKKEKKPTLDSSSLPFNLLQGIATEALLEKFFQLEKERKAMEETHETLFSSVDLYLGDTYHFHLRSPPHHQISS